MLALKALARLSTKTRSSLQLRDLLSENRSILSTNHRYFSQTDSTGSQSVDPKNVYRANFENLQRKQEAEPQQDSEKDQNTADPNLDNVLQEKQAPQEEVATKASKKNFSTTVGSGSILHRAMNYCKEVYEETFPSDNYDRKKLYKKAQAKVQRMTTAETVEYTEEELEKIQQAIPEWKSKSLISMNEGVEEKPSLTKKLTRKLANVINNTQTAQKFYKSEEYKEIEDFRANMTQFKADLKDHMHQSEHVLVQGSVALIDKVKSESGTAKAIKEMRKMDPTFDIYELERDARGIFNDIYSAKRIEKQCGDMALGYFKVLLKKREADKVEPMFKELWETESAELVGGQIPENKFPMFTFTIRTQEIYCNVSKKDQKIVDGAEDRLMVCQYNFVLTPHQNPDLEEIG
eukprot:CAMPEP_0176475096 /NCGR_PEP_ID=MMETSP0127-20121128/43409_1 /TAXON_ID=938130 /ORGANISM="Platyophrya macrostoma, Strain WH" /LENGTH=404 /DNA_ID=CAMNT_0017870639 /DNA_START=37 /DNA_END=1247 /DNA_ORIENTATION=+